jgi:hypothetical protein
LLEGSGGTGGVPEQTCSPSSFKGTGLLQLEHFTVGRSWEILGGPLGDDGEGVSSISYGRYGELWLIKGIKSGGVG